LSEVFGYGLVLYNELSKNASDGLWEGSMVEAFRTTGASNTHYSRLYRTLEQTGCIETLLAARGGGGRVSKIRLIRPPTKDDFSTKPTVGLTKESLDAIIEQRIRNLEGRLPNIDLHELFITYEQRFTELEREVNRLNGT